jgi:hypothetical protein
VLRLRGQDRFGLHHERSVVGRRPRRDESREHDARERRVQAAGEVLCLAGKEFEFQIMPKALTVLV